MDYPNAKFLIYNCWEKDTPYKVAGSVLLDCAITENEAKEKIEVYKARHDDFETKFPYSTTTRFIYIVNQPEWWTRRPQANVSSPKANVSSPKASVEYRPLASQSQDEA